MQGSDYLLSIWLLITQYSILSTFICDLLPRGQRWREQDLLKPWTRNHTSWFLPLYWLCKSQDWPSHKKKRIRLHLLMGGVEKGNVVWNRLLEPFLEIIYHCDNVISKTSNFLFTNQSSFRNGKGKIFMLPRHRTN